MGPNEGNDQPDKDDADDLDFGSASIGRPKADDWRSQQPLSRETGASGAGLPGTGGRKELPPLPFDIEEETLDSISSFSDTAFLINNATSAEASKDERAAQKPILLGQGLKRPTRYGVFLWWPADGVDWICPGDVDLVDEMIPSNRVFRCDDVPADELEEAGLTGSYARVSYGELSFRIRPVLWMEIEAHGYEVGDQVEIRSQMGKANASIGTISEIRFNRDSKDIEYSIDSGGRSAPRTFMVNEFQPAFKLDTPLTTRQLRLIEQAKFR